MVASSPVVVLGALLMVVATALAGQKVDLSKLEESAEKCRAGTAVTKEIVRTLLSSGANMAEPDMATKCYFKCMLQDFGMMKGDGSIMLDENHQHFADCAQQATEDDLCNRAYHFNHCIHLQHPDLPIV